MASPTVDLEAFAQSIYLTIKNRYFDDIESEDGQTFIAQVVDSTNMFLDELENETDLNGQLVDWFFMREQGYALGLANEGSASIELPKEVDRVLSEEQRYVQILQDTSIISNWLVVNASDINSDANRVTEDMCAVVGTSLVFSRAFKDTENGGSIIGDVSLKLTRLSATPANVKVLSIVKPKQLLILGVAKNMTLPDIVQGGLSPSYTQKYTALLEGAIARSKATSISHKATRDNYNAIRGIY